ncbi:MAG TPA: PQQ-binding-like beta-propeller repeat protein [Actinocrinis sp.]|jgi:hypothetical protein
MAVPDETAADRARRRPWRWLIPLVVVVAALAVGGDYLAVRLSSGDGPPTGGLSSLWTDGHAGQGCGDLAAENTPWIAGGLAVACSGSGLAAVHLGTGSVAWTWKPPPVPSGIPAVLQLSTGASGGGVDDGVGVVEYTYGQGTKYVVGLRLSDGHVLWQLPMALQSSDTSALWVGGGRLALTVGPSDSSSGDIDVFDLATGAPAWSVAAASLAPSGCTAENATILGPSVYAVVFCNESTGPTGDQLYRLSLQTGAVSEEAPLQDTSCQLADGGPTIWAVPGYVLTACDSNGGPDMLIIPAGGVRQRSMQYTVKYADDSVQTTIGPPDIVASGDSLYVDEDVNLPHDQEITQIAAIDLATATVRWEQTVSMPDESSDSSSYPVNLLGADADGVFDLMENINGGENTARVTLAMLAASNGALSYGPGTVIDIGHGSQPTFMLAGHTLLAMPQCSEAICTGAAAFGPLTAYGTGSWPS